MLSSHVSSGVVRSGQVRPGQVRSDQIRSGQVRYGCVKSNRCAWHETVSAFNYIFCNILLQLPSEMSTLESGKSVFACYQLLKRYS